MTTRAALRQLIRDELNDNAATKLWADALLNTYVAEAIRDYGRELPREVSMTITVVADHASYARPADFEQAIRVAQPVDVVRLRGERDGWGYRVWGGQLILDPAPVAVGADENVRLEYLARYAEPSADGDTLATGWHNLASGGPGQESRGVVSFAGTIFLTIKSNAGARIEKLDTAAALSGAVLVSSWFDAELPAADKVLVRLTVHHAALASGEAIALDYELDESGVWTNLGSSNTTGAAEKIFAFPSATRGRKLRLRATLTMSTTSSSPKLRELILEYGVMPDLKAQWTFDVLLEGTAEMPLVLLDQSAEPKTGTQLADTLWASKAKKQTLAFTDLDGETKTVYFRDLEERVSPHSQRRGLHTRGRVTLVEA